MFTGSAVGLTYFSIMSMCTCRVLIFLCASSRCSLSGLLFMAPRFL